MSGRTRLSAFMPQCGVFVAMALASCTLDMAGADGDRRNTEPVDTETDKTQEPGLDASHEDARVNSVDATPEERDAAEPPRDAAPEPAADARTRDAGLEDAASEPRDAALRDATSNPAEDAAADASAALADAASEPRDASPPADAAPPSSCALAGTYAALFDYDVNWQGTTLAGIVPLLRPGRGRVRIWSLLEVQESGVRSRVRGCGAELPDFASGNAQVGAELYASYFPEATWDAASMPRWNLAWTPSCLEPGCAIASDALAATLGARVGPNSPWPGPNGSIAQLMLVDHDDDGEPGVTLLPRGPRESSASGFPYSQMPLNWRLNARATRLSMALQVGFRLEGKLESCDALAGTVREGRVENRVVGCHGTAGDAGEAVCTPEQVRFADQNLPSWTVNAGAWRARRIADGASCADVRGALP